MDFFGKNASVGVCSSGELVAMDVCQSVSESLIPLSDGAESERRRCTWTHLNGPSCCRVDVFLCLPGFIIRLLLFGGIFRYKKREHDEHCLSDIVDAAFVRQTHREVGGASAILTSHSHGSTVDSSLFRKKFEVRKR